MQETTQPNPSTWFRETNRDLSVLCTNQQLPLFILFPGYTSNKLFKMEGLFTQPIPLGFLSRSVLLHTLVTLTIDLSNFVFVVYPRNMPMTTRMEELQLLFDVRLQTPLFPFHVIPTIPKGRMTLHLCSGSPC